MPQPQALQQQAEPSVGCRDVLLIGSFAMLAADSLSSWSSFQFCSVPIHKWLLGTYVLMALTCALQILISATASSGQLSSLCLNLRENNPAARLMVNFTWCVCVPVVAMWCMAGAPMTWIIFTQDRDCMPSKMHLFFVGLWQVICGFWVVVYLGMGAMAWVLERKLQQTEREIEEVADDDTARRWGRHFGRMEGFDSLPAGMAAKGLSPSEIRSLEGEGACVSNSARDSQECSICLCSLQHGESIRRLARCGHVFHRSCVDLWLLRCSECPLCKTSVTADPRAAGHGESADQLLLGL